MTDFGGISVGHLMRHVKARVNVLPNILIKGIVSNLSSKVYKIDGRCSKGKDFAKMCIATFD